MGPSGSSFIALLNTQSKTAVKHLDIDAPLLFQGLHEQELSGLWDAKTVQCSRGAFVAGDYFSWREWRNSVSEEPI